MKKLSACIQINKQSALSHPSLARLILLGLPEREREKGGEEKDRGKEREREKGGEREGERSATEQTKKKGIQTSIRR